jgi:tetratricopeptide (TPR) repeat protein
MQIAPNAATIRFATICLAIFLCACQPTAGSEDLALKDPDTSAKLAQLSNSLRTTRNVSNENFKELRSLTERFPASKAVRQTYLEALIVRDDWGTLETYLTGSSHGEISPEDKLLLGKVYIKNGKYLKGLEILEPIAANRPDDFEIIGLLGNVYFHLDQPEKAGPLFDRIWERLVSEKRHEEITMRGLIYFRSGDIEKALEVLNRSFEIKPDQIAANNALSRIYAKLGQKEKAEYHRGLTVNSLDRSVDEKYRASQNVQRVIELENAWKAKDHSRVLTVARQMLPSAPPAQRIVLYQYILGAATATGDKTTADEARAEIQKRQKQ